MVVEPVAVEQTDNVTFESGSYTLDSQRSSIAWNAQKRIGAAHNGTVNAQEGAFIVEQGQVIGGTVVVDMSTIVDLDLTNEEKNATLVGHLKSDDFFDVATYPTATFAISDVTELEEVAGATHTVTGIMTIKGIENEISFSATFETDTDRIEGTGTATLDRTRWDVRYGSDTFFDNLGNELIEDEFTLTFDMVFTAAE